MQGGARAEERANLFASQDVLDRLRIMAHVLTRLVHGNAKGLQQRSMTNTET
jgi:hypothetical protein